MIDSEYLANELNKIDKDLAIKIFSREKLIESIEEKENLIEEHKNNRNLYNQALVLIKTRASDTRKASIEVINEMITSLIKPMFGDDYTFHFSYNEKALESGIKSGFNIIPEITRKVNGKSFTSGIKDSVGGGLCEIISVWLRFAFLKLNNHRGLVILDENWTAVSFDNKMDQLIRHFDDFIDESQSQVLLITHRAEMFGKIADNIVRVVNIDGKANIEYPSYEQILDHSNRMLKNEED